MLSFSKIHIKGKKYHVEVPLHKHYTCYRWVAHVSSSCKVNFSVTAKGQGPSPLGMLLSEHPEDGYIQEVLPWASTRMEEKGTRWKRYSIN